MPLRVPPWQGPYVAFWVRSIRGVEAQETGPVIWPLLFCEHPYPKSDVFCLTCGGRTVPRGSCVICALHRICADENCGHYETFRSWLHFQKIRQPWTVIWDDRLRGVVDGASVAVGRKVWSGDAIAAVGRTVWSEIATVEARDYYDAVSRGCQCVVVRFHQESTQYVIVDENVAQVESPNGFSLSGLSPLMNPNVRLSLHLQVRAWEGQERYSAFDKRRSWPALRLENCVARDETGNSAHLENTSLVDQRARGTVTVLENTSIFACSSLGSVSLSHACTIVPSLRLAGGEGIHAEDSWGSSHHPAWGCRRLGQLSVGSRHGREETRGAARSAIGHNRSGSDRVSLVFRTGFGWVVGCDSNRGCGT